MTDELERLWQLHDLDERAAVIRAQVGKLPELRRSLEARAEAERIRLAAHQKHATDLQHTRRKIEQEIEAVTTQQRQFESRQPMVKTNEEYRALTLEIDACKAKRSDLETGVLLKLEEEERLASERPGIEQTLRAAEAERASRFAEIDRQEAEERERLAAIEAEREAVRAGLPQATRQRYERIHASLDGRAVVPLLKGACGGCFRQQPPQVQQEARRGERLLVCDGCGRLLIWRPEGA